MATTLFGQPTVTDPLQSDTGGYTFGLQFSDSAGESVLAIWFYSGAGAAALPATIALYAVSGQSLVHSESASWSGAAASGWVRAAFGSPPLLTASASYKACVFYAGGANWYSDASHYWDGSGAGNAGLTSGTLTAPNNAGGDGGQDTFTSGTSLAYPASEFNASNYWVDVETGTAGSSAPAGLAASSAAGGTGTGAVRIGMTIRGS